MIPFRWRSIGTLLAVLVLMPSLHAQGSNGTVERIPGIPVPQQRMAEGHVVIVYHSEAINLDPRRRQGFNDERITTLVYSSLVMLDSNGEIYGDLAEEWAFPDPLTVSFKLREDVVFHDGQPLTAEDVKHTLDTVRDPNFASPIRDQFDSIREVEVVGEHEVVLHLNYPSGALLSSLRIGIVPKHADSQQLNTDPVGSGPFKFEEWRAQEYIELEGFEDFYGGAPSLNRLTIIPVREDTTKVQMLETGEADLVWTNVSGQATRLVNQGTFGSQELAGGAEYLMLNLKDESPWQDVRVRQALLHAIDQDAIHHVLFSGFAQKGNNPMPPAMPMHEPDTTFYDYDPEKARQLLEDAGYADGFTVEMITVLPAINELIQHYWKEIGVTVNIHQREVPEYNQVVNSGEYEMVGSPFGLRADPDALLYEMFHSSSMVPGDGRNNGYVNPRVDELLDLGRSTADPAERQAYYSELQQILTDEVPLLVLGYPSALLLYNPYLEGAAYGSFSLFRDTALNARWTSPE